MPTPFPGMDPYLEQSGIWKQVHTELIVDIQRWLAPRLRPKYKIAIEEYNFFTMASEELEDLTDDRPSEVVHEGAYVVKLPQREAVMQRYLEILDRANDEVITAIEILLPRNKLEERKQYEHKRLRNLASMTHLVEIDLLRTGEPMAMTGDFPQTDYRVLVSRAWQRPYAQIFPFTVRQAIPDIPIPVRQGDDEPLLPLNQLLHSVYDSGMYSGFIDYHKPPRPPLEKEDAEWAQQLCNTIL